MSSNCEGVRLVASAPDPLPDAHLWSARRPTVECSQCSYSSCCRPFHVLCGRAAGNLLTFRTTDGEPLQFCSTHSGERFAARRDAACDGVESAAEPGEVPAAEPAELVEYEVERNANVQRIEEVKKKMFSKK